MTSSNLHDLLVRAANALLSDNPLTRNEAEELSEELNSAATEIAAGRDSSDGFYLSGG
jgi:hypothetical protein